MGLVIDRFMKEERIEEILKQKPGVATITDGISYSTAAGYRSYIKNHVKPKWSDTPLAAVKPLEVAEWLKLAAGQVFLTTDGPPCQEPEA